MSDEILRIDRLHLHIPGLGRDEAYLLGKEVCRQVADGLGADKTPIRLGTLQLRILAPRNYKHDHLSKSIADSILGVIE